MKKNPFTPCDATVGSILKLCRECRKYRDTEELFEHSASNICLFCERKPELITGRWVRANMRTGNRQYRRSKTETTKAPKVARTPSE